MIQHSKKVPLEDWIKEALNDPDKEGPCTALALVHLLATNVGIAQEEIHSIKVGDQGYDPNAIAAMFKHKAQTYSQDLTGVQSFMLLAFYGASKEPQAKHPFRVQGETQFEGLATENPTETGKLAQGMRLTEAIVQGSFRQNSITFDTMIRTLDAHARQNQQLIEQNWQAFEFIKQLIIEREKSNHEYRLQEENRKMLTKLVGFLPPLANSIMGEKVFPESTEDSQLIESIAEELANHPEKMVLLQKLVPEKTWPMVAARLTEILQKRKAESQPTNGKAEHELS